jgi:hypothetical protein
MDSGCVDLLTGKLTDLRIDSRTAHQAGVETRRIQDQAEADNDDQSSRQAHPRIV